MTPTRTRSLAPRTVRVPAPYMERLAPAAVQAARFMKSRRSSSSCDMCVPFMEWPEDTTGFGVRRPGAAPKAASSRRTPYKTLRIFGVRCLGTAVWVWLDRQAGAQGRRLGADPKGVPSMYDSSEVKVFHQPDGGEG